MEYGYARVSTVGQAKYGSGLDTQVKELEDAGAGIVFQDTCSGTNMNRPGWNQLIAVLQPGDVLIITSLDRLSRSMRDGCEVVQGLIEEGVTVNVLNMGTVEDSPLGRFVMSVMFAMSEFEREQIAEKMQKGKAVARQREDFSEGRPRMVIDEDAFEKLREKVAAREMTVREAAEALGVSESTWRRRVKEVDAA